MKTLLVPVAALLVVATASIAQPNGSGDAGSTNSQANTKTNDKGERLICRWVQDADVGSLVSGRTRRCLTAEQWRVMPRAR